MDRSTLEETKEKFIANLSVTTPFIAMNPMKIFSGSNILQTTTLIQFLMVMLVLFQILNMYFYDVNQKIDSEKN